MTTSNFSLHNLCHIRYSNCGSFKPFENNLIITKILLKAEYFQKNLNCKYFRGNDSWAYLAVTCCRMTSEYDKIIKRKFCSILAKFLAGVLNVHKKRTNDLSVGSFFITKAMIPLRPYQKKSQLKIDKIQYWNLTPTKQSSAKKVLVIFSEGLKQGFCAFLGVDFKCSHIVIKNKELFRHQNNTILKQCVEASILENSKVCQFCPRDFFRE